MIATVLLLATFAVDPTPCEPEGIPATFTRIIDGDTFEMTAHLPLGVHIEVTVRPLGIDTPEMRGLQRQLGIKAKAFTETWAGTYPDVYLFPKSKGMYGKYGRLLARVCNAGGQCLDEELRKHGHEKRKAKKR